MTALVGCSGTVAPPVAPPHPTTVYLCDYGYHSSLLLPVSDGVYVEYLYGDWNWAAENQTGMWGAVHALFLSSGATLGRRYVYDPRPGVVPVPVLPADHQVPLVVNGDSCRQLQLDLDRRWRAQIDTAVYSGPVGGYYVFVRDGEPYGAVHNCNRMTAGWLRQLGCRTGGWSLLSRFTVDTPPTPTHP